MLFYCILCPCFFPVFNLVIFQFNLNGIILGSTRYLDVKIVNLVIYSSSVVVEYFPFLLYII